ncbi:F0F1 ATP synthase subunit gamma [Caballeronia sp. dw_19]|uniref:F0F1 ATP synthase subunit gamma n=1 Tax=Caballeronia sp. dw_19 TaxID=2719791 RepID=UPI001BD2AE18|nr:F0F1 ATP synthase subunit gamma [Caballeronia sp. dw_19]
MSNKLSEVQARMNGVHGLESVVGAMRGIAAARSREARSRLDGIRACARIVSAAIGDALLLIDDHASHETAAPDRDAKHDASVVIVLCAEQGFVGTFNEHVIDAALASSTAYARTEYLLLGDRGIVAATERGLNVGWSAPMITHADEVPALADRLTGVLFQRLVAGRTTRVSVIHATPNPTASVQTVEQTLLPFDYERFSGTSPATPRRNPPLINLAPQRLLSQLAEEYIFAQLCEAIMLSFAAENEARMRAMIAARTNVHDKLEALTGDFRRLRQEEITSEIVELSAGSIAADRPSKKTRPEPTRHCGNGSVPSF